MLPEEPGQLDVVLTDVVEEQVGEEDLGLGHQLETCTPGPYLVLDLPQAGLEDFMRGDVGNSIRVVEPSHDLLFLGEVARRVVGQVGVDAERGRYVTAFDERVHQLLSTIQELRVLLIDNGTSHEQVVWKPLIHCRFPRNPTVLSNI